MPPRIAHCHIHYVDSVSFQEFTFWVVDALTPHCFGVLHKQLVRAHPVWDTRRRVQDADGSIVNIVKEIINSDEARYDQLNTMTCSDKKSEEEEEKISSGELALSWPVKPAAVV
mmetsp:Transcript_2224/g.8180  ORF Transcript_2224/g.8180 Transcript_2224/m.8180 type:complete len:114 (-) Transcript_2224:247-588(-)